MVTDAQILTAAREVAAAVEAVKAADAAKLESDRANTAAAAKCEEARKRQAEAQGMLLRLSSAKPAEPVKVEPPVAKYLPVSGEMGEFTDNKAAPKGDHPSRVAPVPNLSNPRRGASHVPPARTGH